MKVLELYEIDISQGVTLKIYNTYTNAKQTLALDIYLGENLLMQWDKEEGLLLNQELHNIELMSYCSLFIRELSNTERFMDFVDSNKIDAIVNYITDLDTKVTNNLSDST